MKTQQNIMASVLLVGVTATFPALATSLKDCPDKPNCVSSQASAAERQITPIAYTSDATTALQRLLKTLNALENVEVIEANDNYLHATFTSGLFGFVDDVEFVLDDPNKVIHVRSASRVGYWDMGANRQRVEDLRARFNNPQ